MLSQSPLETLGEIVEKIKQIGPGARKTRKAADEHLERVRKSGELGREAVREAIQNVPESVFPYFVQGLFQYRGFKVDRLTKTHPYRAHAFVRSDEQSFLIRCIEAVPRREKGFHVARSVDELALQCELRGVRGIYVIREIIIEPMLVRRSGSEREGSSIAALYLEDLVDLAMGYCVNDPATGYTLLSLAEAKPAQVRTHHVYKQKEGLSRGESAVDVGCVDPSAYGDESKETRGASGSLQSNAA
ncbi:hypothetical protein [Thioalkalivibrio sp. ALE16]|uniref:hypothetical protein n=1 Tax=Thioalkalivibrio sp. ALE16 TaxID=1158172 RepID=UPI0003721164|nr:hypothetical protein [Thioalkalivibrio sp. ALE16]